MGNLINFYNTLFTAEIAVFGIISAVVFIFIQLVYINYTYRHIWHILKNPLLIIFTFFSVFNLIATSLSSYFLSIGKHDIFPNIYFATNSIILNQYFSLSCLLLFIVSIFIFLIYLFANVSYLQPHKAIFLVLKNIKYKQIRNYLWKKFKLEIPFNIKFIAEKYIIKVIDVNQPKEQREEEIKKKTNEAEKERQRIEKEIERINKKIEKAEDPLLPIRDMAIQFIRKSDLNSLTETKDLIMSISNNFIKNIPNNESDKWYSESSLLENYITHIIEILKSIIEISRKENLESAQKIIIETSYELSCALLKIQHFAALDKILLFWQTLGDSYIGTSPLLFQEILNCYNNILNKTFDLLKEKHITDSRDSKWIQLENIFRHIGWLGEKLLMETSIKEEPLIYNNDYSHSTEYDTLINIVLSIGDRFNREQTEFYPLIYFDVLSALGEKIIKLFKKNKNDVLARNIYDIAYVYFSFFEKAICINNFRGAALATKEILDFYKKLKASKLNKRAKEVIDLLVNVGVIAAGQKEKNRKINFMSSKTIDEWVIDELVEAKEDIDGSVSEAYIKSTGGNHDDTWEFIVKLGMKMSTNFGFMFDATTGKLYADDDPRRH